MSRYAQNIMFLLLCCSFLTSSKSKHLEQCTDFCFHVHTSSSNDSGILIPAAKYHISAIHCPPTKHIASRSSTVQLLVHGGFGNKLIWSALAPVDSKQAVHPYKYSWVDYARADGYHTVAIDRLGTGNSSHPSPAFVGLFLQTAIINEIITRLRRGGVTVNVPGFDTVIGVGHSIGSLLLGLMVPVHPNSLDAVILTGFIVEFYAAVTSGNALKTNNSTVLPAEVIFPTRFAGLDPGYLTIAQESYLQSIFFSGKFDPAVAELLWEREDVQATRELLDTAALRADPDSDSRFNVSGSGFDGDVAIVTGAEDIVFCGTACGNYVEKSLEYYLSSSGNLFAYKIAKTGHFVHFHHSARKTFEIVHAWLRRIGY